MNILLGVQTTGNGHIVRGLALLHSLRARGHRVRCVLSGPSTEGRWDISPFKPCRLCTGLTFRSRAGRLSYLRTAFGNRPLRFLRDAARLPWRDLDLVITDYEPVTAWMARRRGLPGIGIGHMYVFRHDVPKAGARFGHWVTNAFAPVRYPMGSHWHHFGQPLLPPTLPDDVYALEPAAGDHYLVYLPFEDTREVIRLLQAFPEQRFRLYTGAGAAGEQGNVTLCRIGRRPFIEDLARARGVLCNAGFSLVSEALHLGKKVLVKPLARQVEQESNAVALTALGYGHWMQHLDADAVRGWLEMPAIEACRWPRVIEPLADWIGDGHWDRPEPLLEQLWKNAARETCLS